MLQVGRALTFAVSALVRIARNRALSVNGDAK